MNNLIAELERATEGSRELDAKIAEVVIWPSGRGRELQEAGHAFYETAQRMCKRYTTSLDAALTLVPEGHRCSFDIPGKEGGKNHATVVKYSQVLEAVNLKAKPKKIIELWNHSYAATPALALCIAALRARQAMEEAG